MISSPPLKYILLAVIEGYERGREAEKGQDTGRMLAESEEEPTISPQAYRLAIRERLENALLAITGEVRRSGPVEADDDHLLVEVAERYLSTIPPEGASGPPIKPIIRQVFKEYSENQDVERRPNVEDESVINRLQRKFRENPRRYFILVTADADWDRRDNLRLIAQTVDLMAALKIPVDKKVVKPRYRPGGITEDEDKKPGE